MRLGFTTSTHQGQVWPPFAPRPTCRRSARRPVARVEADAPTQGAFGGGRDAGLELDQGGRTLGGVRKRGREGGDSAAAPRSRIGGGRDTGLEIVQGGTTLGGGRKRGSGGSAIREKKLT